MKRKLCSAKPIVDAESGLLAGRLVYSLISLDLGIMTLMCTPDTIMVTPAAICGRTKRQATPFIDVGLPLFVVYINSIQLYIKRIHNENIFRQHSF